MISKTFKLLAQAEAAFKATSQRQVDHSPAVREYYGAQRALTERTHKLREPRLARNEAVRSPHNGSSR
jgi:hypothetical protein